MLNKSFNYTPPAALTGSMRDYRHPRGSDLQDRVEGFAKWRSLRRQHGLCNDAGGASEGFDFAGSDHLGLSAHPAIIAVAQLAIERFGVHGAAHTGPLEKAIADFTASEDAVLFPNGWSAAFGAIKGLVRSTDHVIMDAGAHAGLHEGAAASTRNIYLFRHNRLEECRDWLEKIRARDAENGVLVVTESLFSTELDSPDLAALQTLCQEFGATLLVDASRDLGLQGEDGRGEIAQQGMLGKIDLIAGSLSFAFGADGGFVACRATVAEYLRGFSSACAAPPLSPGRLAAALKAFEIAESSEGQSLRARLAANVQTLRQGLAEAGLELQGDPAPVVSVALGSEALARLVGRQLGKAGLKAETMEFPAAPKGHARLRLHVSASHAEARMAPAVEAIRTAVANARAEAEWLQAQREKLRAG